MDQIDCIVAGAGVIGLAVARQLALSGREVLIIEKAPAIGTETSSRNSEVLHAGLYYEPHSLKASLCVEGQRRLYEYMPSRAVAHRRTGKLIVATQAGQASTLEAIATRARACGVHDLQLLTASQAKEMEPALACTAALYSPSTGILDSHGLMLALLGDAQANNAVLSLNTEVIGLEDVGSSFVVHTRNMDQGETFAIAARCIVNAAGHGAPALAGLLFGGASPHVPQLNLAKGNYFSCAVRAPFQRLIYPVPEPGGLGTHLTLDLQGAARFGPDVEWVDQVDYHVDGQRGVDFYGAIRRYWPGLPDGALIPAFCGVRPKLSGPGEPAADFRIDGPDHHGLPGLVNLFGIESPGLTSCLAIAQHVADMIK